MPSRPARRSRPCCRAGSTRITLSSGTAKPMPESYHSTPATSRAAVGRQRHEHAQHAAGDIDQRPAVVVGRDLGVGLNRLAPDAIQRADDADRDIRLARLRTCGPRPGPTGRRASRFRAPTSGTASLASVSTFSSTSMRLWSVATSLAARREPPSSVTRIESGFCTKLNALEMM